MVNKAVDAFAARAATKGDATAVAAASDPAAASASVGVALHLSAPSSPSVPPKPKLPRQSTAGRAEPRSAATGTRLPLLGGAVAAASAAAAAAAAAAADIGPPNAAAVEAAAHEAAEADAAAAALQHLVVAPIRTGRALRPVTADRAAYRSLAMEGVTVSHWDTLATNIFMGLNYHYSFFYAPYTSRLCCARLS